MLVFYPKELYYLILCFFVVVVVYTLNSQYDNKKYTNTGTRTEETVREGSNTTDNGLTL